MGAYQLDDRLVARNVAQNRAPLAPQPYKSLPLGSIRPAGWLRRQLEIQAAGLSGHLDEVWPDAGPNSGWLGGNGESWERGPYYLDGLVPLAWLLDSQDLKSKAQRFVDWTLENPWPDGMIGPRNNNDWWPRMVMLKALTQYYEVTSDPRVIRIMAGYFEHQLRELPKRPLESWGRFRWQDELESVIWLYNRTGEPQLLELAQLLHVQGWDWRAAFDHFPFKEKVSWLEMVRLKYALTKAGSDDVPMSAHGVNNAMGIKASPLWYLISRDKQDCLALQRQLSLLDEYHGLPTGIFSADEHLAGRSPSQGIELCAVVETLHSLEVALAITGDPVLGDRIERIAYNALPAALTDDMWAHQYDQQANQIECSVKPGPWTTNGPDANLFGLEPHFGCCTANFHQGWPKLTSSLWMASSDGGLAAMIYGPCEVSTSVNGIPVRLREETNYPFRDHVQINIEVERPVEFPLKLRLPGSARDVSLCVNGRPVGKQPRNGFLVLARRWQSGDQVDIAFNFATRAVRGFQDSVSVQHGALIFALPIASRWVKLREDKLTADWEVHPSETWNYALSETFGFERHEREMGSVPFSGNQPAVSVSAAARLAPEWGSASDGNYAMPPPASPVLASGEVRELELIPYGAAKLRITSFPSCSSELPGKGQMASSLGRS